MNLRKEKKEGDIGVVNVIERERDLKGRTVGGTRGYDPRGRDTFVRD